MTIFLSYRRDDSQGWTGRVYDCLAQRFTRSRVFMDVDGQIKPGDEYPALIDQQLQQCRVLVVVIGPRWLAKNDAGVRRIDAENDWVRREIRTSLARGIPIFPVLVDGAQPALLSDVPSDLSGLATRIAAAIDITQWDQSRARLLKLVATALGDAPDPRGDIALVSTALALLIEQMERSTAVAQVVGRYREALAVNIAQLTELDVYKRMHDALHVLEERGLRVLRQNRTSRPQLMSCRTTFAQSRDQIEKCLSSHRTIPAGVAENLRSGLAALADVLSGPDDPSRVAATIEAAIEELSSLVGILPTQLDQKIASAAAALREHGRLDQLARELRACVEREAPARVADLQPLFVGVDGLEDLRGTFSRLVEEHTRLQFIDTKLRALCASPSKREWDRLRERLLPPPPSLPQIEARREEFVAYRDDVDQAFASDPAGAQVPLEALHGTFVTLFHDVDVHLLTTSNEVAVIHGPLKQLHGQR